MLHANDSSPTKAHGSLMMRMKREVFPRSPQVSVVTRTIYASSTATATSTPEVENVPIPLGPIVGGIIGGMMIVLVALGAWWWWGSRLRESKAKGAKARRAQHLTAARTGHTKTESTETLKTNASRSKPPSLSEKTNEKQPANAPVAQESVQSPSTILAQERNGRRPFMHQSNSSASLASSKYAPTRPSPLALNVMTRAPSAMSDNPPTVVVTAPPQPNSSGLLSPQSAALRSLSPLPPKVNVVPPSPPPPVHRLVTPAADRNQRQSVQSVQSAQSVASEYSLDSPIGVAYGGDELEREPYINPRDEWRSSQDDIMSRMRTAAQARGPFGDV